MKSDNNVSVIDTATNMVVATVPMGDDPRGVAVTLTGNKPVTLRTLATPTSLP
jgi:YVTN family beta-propeller protein